ncbi:hypothetical protein SKAU_G00290010 [Synaphobranchus kaupii]|uniref:Uncharacterized protein n=1 Tax=Synaphobranchus kaupii TaxID=118154 RepID=A0A9Q1ETM9_SYNKA|nr:hypothetical protein SKAU_G00290010 [Synaphobranchus kaupii]
MQCQTRQHKAGWCREQRRNYAGSRVGGRLLFVWIGGTLVAVDVLLFLITPLLVTVLSAARGFYSESLKDSAHRKHT